MIEMLFDIVVFLMVLGVIFFIVNRFVTIDPWWRQLLGMIVAIVLVIALFQAFFGVGNFGFHALR